MAGSCDGARVAVQRFPFPGAAGIRICGKSGNELGVRPHWLGASVAGMSPKPLAARTPLPPRVYQVAYSTATDGDETPRLHHMRDGHAALELMATLAEHGYAYETALHFYPNTPRRQEKFTFLQPDDLLLLTTRPPLEMRLQHGAAPFVRGLKHSRNGLEIAIFEALAPFFTFVGRNAIELSPRAAAWLEGDAESFGELLFTRNNHALIEKHGVCGTNLAYLTQVNHQFRNSAGYFIKLRKIRRYPCGLVCCFAPGGVEDLLFARLVRRHHTPWLAPDWQGFGFIRFYVPAGAEDAPLSVASLDDQIVETVLAEHEFDSPPPAARRARG
jgi:hypothetical protein